MNDWSSTFVYGDGILADVSNFQAPFTLIDIGSVKMNAVYILTSLAWLSLSDSFSRVKESS